MPVLTILSSRKFLAFSGRVAQALRLWIIWMRQLLPTKPFTSARRQGPGFAGLDMVFVVPGIGLKHWG